MKDLIVMLVEGCSIFGTGALANEFIIKLLVKNERGEIMYNSKCFCIKQIVETFGDI
ncbi:MAG: hypothetical protein SOY42_07290 [Clostridium sp.]|nr:hypothetical protein [Clostridium sp.]